MKTPLLIVAFVMATCFNAIAQDKKSLETQTAKMYQNTVDANYTEMVEDMYPKYFDIAPKEQLVEAYKKTDNPNYKMDIIYTMPNFEYGPIKKVGEGSYCIIKHDLRMKMTFKTILPAGEEEKLKESFKTNLQANSVVYNPKDNSFTITKRDEVIAVADKLTKNQWKFVKKGPTSLMEKLLDKKVVKALGL
ncbi:hypothetical protein [Flavobacterium subsaxonicum]|uniref:DUF4468 domain-containing protein n=1 Tax=Flavobacterium subsaxonicum WB 4.1-42 = DSM 21790 TaxID=1121898 RepID=A0A0A2MVY4_9FLAO|nr:hypothetical protein [Flavobacterium subsaxonicum]KGO92390.1 hypothetical protein Q766_13075 [Flavobacterium subsaxonicum WB 4.1-42 = DSM 21790]